MCIQLCARSGAIHDNEGLSTSPRGDTLVPAILDRFSKADGHWRRMFIQLCARSGAIHDNEPLSTPSYDGEPASSSSAAQHAAMPHATLSDEQLEALLEIIDEQRARHLSRHPHLATVAVFDEKGMREIVNTWQHDYRTWMYSDDMVTQYEWLLITSDLRAEDLLRQNFLRYLFRIIGNKHLLLACIQHPIRSAAQPAIPLQPAAPLGSFLEYLRQ